MTRSIRNHKDFWTGLIYASVGIASFFIARGYSFGSAGRMGPGYFPSVISGLLLLVGAIAIVRSFVTSRKERVGVFAMKPMVLITGAVIAFGLLINVAGLVIALLTLVLMSAAGSELFRFEWRAVFGLIALILFCSAVFVWGLGVPMPLAGSWLGPFLPASIGG